MSWQTTAGWPRSWIGSRRVTTKRIKEKLCIANKGESVGCPVNNFRTPGAGFKCKFPAQSRQPATISKHPVQKNMKKIITLLKDRKILIYWSLQQLSSTCFLTFLCSYPRIKFRLNVWKIWSECRWHSFFCIKNIVNQSKMCHKPRLAVIWQKMHFTTDNDWTPLI